MCHRVSEAAKTHFGVDIIESSLFVAFAVSEDNFDIVAQNEMLLTKKYDSKFKIMIQWKMIAQLVPITKPW